MCPKKFGQYRVTKSLAHTEYADVYEAEDAQGRAYAVKALRVDGVDAALVDALFQREIAALDGFEQDGIATLRHYGKQPDGTPFLVFDLVPGGQTLQSLLVASAEGYATKPMGWRLAEAQRLVRSTGAAHARHVIHRDLKPSNILVDADRDCLVICDFGVANVLTRKVLNPGGRTLRDLFTRPYAAPEQCLRGEALFAADVHALSLLITALLALRLPEDAFTLVDFDALWAPAKREIEALLAPPASVLRLEATLKAGLAEKAADRPTISSLGAALEEVRASITPPASATLVLSHTVEQKLLQLGIEPRAAADDLNATLAVRLDESGDRPRIKMYGRSLLAVAAWDAGQESRVTIIDVKSVSGPQLANDRRAARPIGVIVSFGKGDGSALVSAARESRGLVQSERVTKLLDVAQRVIDLERERLPIIEVEVIIENGTSSPAPREARVGQAAGYRGSGVERTRVKNARVRIVSVTRPLEAAKPNVLGGLADDVGPIAAADVPSLYESFDDMQVCSPFTLKPLGKVTYWHPREDDGAVIAVFAFDDADERPRRIKVWIADALSLGQLNKQEMALEQLRERRARLSSLPELLTLTSAHALEDRTPIEPFQPFLKADKRVIDIIERALAAKVSCVCGPPGTGKTTLIVELVLQLLKKDPRQRILICSQANEAVSNALERLQDRATRAMLPTSPWIVRDVREELRVASKNDGLEPAFHAEAEEWRRRATAFAEASSSAATKVAITEWCRDLENSAAGTREEFAAHVQVWGATTSRSGSTLRQAQAEDWDVVIVDEAAKATLAEVLVPLVSARRIVLVGDHKQLPPFLDSVTAEQLEQTGVDPDEAKLSLFQHLFETVLPESHKGAMITQSRMHPSIGALVSKLFYESKLRHNVTPAQRPLPPGRFDVDHRVLFLGFTGSDEQTAELSRRNPKEAEQIVRVVKALDVDAKAGGKRLSVSVITPYKAQAHELTVRLKVDWAALDVRVGTVHTFQGRQSDVVIYSLTRTGSVEWTFLADPRLFNVALSRARSLLVLVGDLAGAPATPILEQLLADLPAENKVRLDTFLGATVPTHKE